MKDIKIILKASLLIGLTLIVVLLEIMFGLLGVDFFFGYSISALAGALISLGVLIWIIVDWLRLKQEPLFPMILSAVAIALLISFVISAVNVFRVNFAQSGYPVYRKPRYFFPGKFEQFLGYPEDVGDIPELKDAGILCYSTDFLIWVAGFVVLGVTFICDYFIEKKKAKGKD